MKVDLRRFTGQFHGRQHPMKEGGLNVETEVFFGGPLIHIQNRTFLKTWSEDRTVNAPAFQTDLVFHCAEKVGHFLPLPTLRFQFQDGHKHNDPG
jgi:hypothetical protein